MRRPDVPSIAVLTALAALALAAATVGGCRCSKTASPYVTPPPPPEPPTATAYPTSSLFHSRAYVSQWNTGNLYYAEFFPGTTTGTATPAPAYVQTVTPPAGFSGAFGPAYVLASPEDRNTLVSCRQGVPNLWVLDTTSPLNTSGSFVATSPPLNDIRIAKFAPPRGPFADHLFVASVPIAGTNSTIAYYKFCGGAPCGASATFAFSERVKDLAVTPDGNRLLLLTAYDLYVYELTGPPPWPLLNNQPVQVGNGDTGQALAVHPNNTTVFIATQTTSTPNGLGVWFYSLYSGNNGTVVRDGGTATKLFCEPSGRLLLVLDGSNKISVYDVSVTPPVQRTVINVPDPGGTSYDLDYCAASRSIVLTDGGSGSTSMFLWHADLSPYFDSGGAAQPNFWPLDGMTGPRASHVRFGK